MLYLYVLSLATAVYGEVTQNCTSQSKNGATLKVYSTHCYEFQLRHKVDWKAAEGDCSSRGGTLVVINDAEEQNFLMSSLKALSFHGSGVWIGLSDTNHEGTFTWVTGENSSFTFWAPGQPHLSHAGKRFILDGLVDEDCVLMKYSESGHWHDYPCQKLDPFGLVREHYPYICEYDTGTTSAPSVAPTMAPSTMSTTSAALPASPRVPSQ
ncbi:galactose-specific lectin nattectin-like [Saccostrea echinata]|uniref:galactose-specific lectin nattectin-like n=1 Tax=Saccostrea echinata TaxID=191078 RepID=UPI002A7F7E01|nr:galactose-specific lectin nattectin-like [Saccostrea echinata]